MGISTAISLNDNITSVLTNINNALNMTISAFYEVNDASGTAIDTSMFDAVREYTNAATIGLQNMRQEAEKPVAVTLQNAYQEPERIVVIPELKTPDDWLQDIEVMEREAQDRLNDISLQMASEIRPPHIPDDWLQDVMPGNLDYLEIPLKWDTSGIEVFTNTGSERYIQEIQSANDMMEQLSSAQLQIQNQAASLDFFPENMVTDITSISNRIINLQANIQKIKNNPLNELGADKTNAEIEKLREQLNTALEQQSNLNQAMKNMDISAANAAYERLNTVVNSTERYIRDNVDEQGSFNNQIQQGIEKADNLKNKILGMAAAYLSVRGASKVLNVADTMTQTEARLNLIVDDGGTVDELQNKIYASTQRARGLFTETSGTVSKLGILAKNAFSGTDEIIAFTELMNKNFVIGGASIQMQTSAMYQLTQAMAAGKLQGDEYRSIIENAPLLAQAIEQYMTDAGVEGTMKEWASDGLLTADVIKNALFSVADETNETFKQMPVTFAQVGNSLKNNALMAFRPVLNKISEITQSEKFQVMVRNITNAFVILSKVALDVFDILMSVGKFISDNWSLIAPIVYGIVTALAIYTAVLIVHNVTQATSNGLKALAAFQEEVHAAATMMSTGATFAQTAAQHGLNAALLACPLTWIIITIIALIAIIYLVVAAINKFAGTSVSATGIIFGAFFWLGSVIANIFMGILEIAFGVINTLVNPFIWFANFIGNLMNDPIAAIIYGFQGMADGVLAMLQRVASGMDFVFGTNMAGKVQGWRDGLKGLADKAVVSLGYNPEDYNRYNELDLSVKNTLGWDRFDNTDAFMAGYNKGQTLEDSIKNLNPSSILDNGYEDILEGINATAYNTDEIKKELNMSNEDLKYLRDIAERDVINRFTTAEIKVDFSSQNTVNSNMDLDGMISYLEERVTETLVSVAEGVHE